MNRPILILCFFIMFFMGPPLYAEVHGSFEVGRDIDRPEAYAKVDLDYSFPVVALTIHIYGGWETWLQTGTDGLPYTMMYDVLLTGLKVDIDDIYVDVHHWCSHPLWSNPPYKGNTNVYIHQIRTIVSVGVKW